MIHKYQGIYGTMFVLQQSSSTLAKELDELVAKLEEEKTIPFSSVYVKIPALAFQKFLDVCDSKNLKYKDIEMKKNIFLVKF